MNTTLNEIYDTAHVMIFRLVIHLVLFLEVYIVIIQPYEIIVCALLSWVLTTPHWAFMEDPKTEEPWTDEERCYERCMMIVDGFVSDIHITLSIFGCDGDWKKFLVLEVLMYLFEFAITPAVGKVMKYCGLNPE